jgi:hypothetical protein
MRMVVRAGLVDHKVGFHKLDLELEKIHSVHHFQTIRCKRHSQMFAEDRNDERHGIITKRT